MLAIQSGTDVQYWYSTISYRVLYNTALVLYNSLEYIASHCQFCSEATTS